MGSYVPLKGAPRLKVAMLCPCLCQGAVWQLSLLDFMPRWQQHECPRLQCWDTCALPYWHPATAVTIFLVKFVTDSVSVITGPHTSACVTHESHPADTPVRIWADTCRRQLGQHGQQTYNTDQPLMYCAELSRLSRGLRVQQHPCTTRYCDVGQAYVNTTVMATKAI